MTKNPAGTRTSAGAEAGRSPSARSAPAVRRLSAAEVRKRLFPRSPHGDGDPEMDWQVGSTPAPSTSIDHVVAAMVARKAGYVPTLAQKELAKARGFRCPYYIARLGVYNAVRQAKVAPQLQLAQRGYGRLLTKKEAVLAACVEDLRRIVETLTKIEASTSSILQGARDLLGGCGDGSRVGDRETAGAAEAI